MNLQETLTSIFEKSMLISEKRHFYNGKVTEENLDLLKKWKNQKNLVTDDILKLILEQENMTENEFAYAISPIQITESYDMPEWLKVFKKILSNFDLNTIQNLPHLDISISILPFINFIYDEIIHFDWGNSEISLSDQAVQDILNNYIIQTLGVFEKCLVIELNEYKEHVNFSSNDPQKQFIEFLKANFDTKEKYYTFYEKYAVSTRIATQRSVYFLNNLSQFFHNYIISSGKINSMFNIPAKNIDGLTFSVGDTHEKGKEVIIVKLGNNKIVYKPKNLDICEAFTKFIDYINNNLDGLNLKTPKGIYNDNFAFLEFIEYKSCNYESEVEHFYERFGYFLAIGYFLSITDLHLENIIACGEYPIIVDGETMMQNSVKYYKEESAITRFYNEYYIDTILSTALLPNTAKIDNSLDLSGLAGDEQKSQKKYLTAVNIGTSNFHFEEIEYTMEGADNIPMLNGRKVNYKNYRHHIINGFLKVYNFVRINQKDFLSNANSPLLVFRHKKIRFLTKSTQKYGEMLSYLNHPSCCYEMSVRERVLQNIWAYPHINKEIIKSEYKEMLFNDIPIFYSFTDSLDLYDAYGNTYKSYFNQSGYQKVLNRIRDIGDRQLSIQMDLLLFHLSLYDEYKRSEFSRKFYTFNFTKINALNEAEKIAHKIIDESIEDSFNNIIWKQIDIKETATSLGLTGLDLYDGLSGIAIFFLELYRISNKKIYYTYYNKCINNCAKNIKYSPDHLSAYISKFSTILPIALEIKYFNSSKHENVLYQLVESLEAINITDIKTAKNYSIDWINGISGLLVMLLEIKEHFHYLSTQKFSFLSKFIQTLKDMILEKLEDTFSGIGQAHGYCGVMLALARYAKDANPSEKRNLLNIIKMNLKKEMELYELEYQENRDKWCGGLSGMILSRIEISQLVPELNIDIELKTLIDKLIICQKDIFVGDSLCHGNSGTLFVIKHLIDNGLDSENKLLTILNKMLSQMWGESLYHGYNLVGSMCVNNMGLFTGYAGVGLMYLKLYDTTVFNILALLL